MNTNTNHIAGVARSAMLVTLEIRLYTGRKQDKKTTSEVTLSKAAMSTKASSVYKNLFAECKELDAIVKYSAVVRAEHYRLTLPWNDFGARLLPTANLLDYQTKMGACRTEFERLAKAFLVRYDTLVSAAAFQLGKLFDRAEYPPKEAIARRFTIESAFTPLPLAGDFRLDIEAEVQNDLAKSYERDIEQRMAGMAQDAWDRLYKVLARLSDRLTANEDGTKRVFHDTLVHNAVDLCDLLTKLNPMGDQALEKARRQLEEALLGVEPAELRKEEGARMQVKHKVDAILDAFDWGNDDADDLAEAA